MHDPRTTERLQQAIDSIWVVEHVPVGERAEQILDGIRVAGPQHGRDRSADLFDRAPEPQVEIGIGVQQQPVAVSRDRRQLLDPRRMLRAKALEIGLLPAVYSPHRPQERVDSARLEVRETPHGEQERLVVPEQAAHRPLTLEPHHEVDRADPVRAAVDEIAE